MSTIFAEVKNKLGDAITILKIDVDKSPKAAAAYQIQSMPTLLLFKNGEIKWRQSGVVAANELIKLIAKHTA